MFIFSMKNKVENQFFFFLVFGCNIKSKLQKITSFEFLTSLNSKVFK
jgi:hypothetical protein